jgi:hypothetical protein
LHHLIRLRITLAIEFGQPSFTRRHEVLRSKERPDIFFVPITPG